MTDWDLVLTTGIRVFNALIWTVVLWSVLSNRQQVSNLTRTLIIGLIISGFWLLAIGSLAPALDIGPFVRLAYTAYTAISALIGLALLLAHPHI